MSYRRNTDVDVVFQVFLDVVMPCPFSADLRQTIEQLLRH